MISQHLTKLSQYKKWCCIYLVHSVLFELSDMIDYAEYKGKGDAHTLVIQMMENIDSSNTNE